MTTLKEWLEELGLGQYQEELKCRGWDSIRAILCIKQATIDEIFKLEGHRCVFTEELEELKTQYAAKKTTGRAVIQTALPDSYKSSEKKPPSMMGCVGNVKPTGYKAPRVYYESAIKPKRKFSNKTLEEIFPQVSPWQDKFDQKLISEVDARWEFVNLMEDLERKFGYMTGGNPAYFGKYLNGPPEPILPKHRDHLASGIKDFQDLKTKASQSIKAFQQNNERLGTEEDSDKWAVLKKKYYSEKMSELRVFMDKVDTILRKLEGTQDIICKVVQSLPNSRKNSTDTRRIKENKHKSKVRLNQRGIKATYKLMDTVPQDIVTDQDLQDERLKVVPRKTLKTAERFINGCSLMSTGAQMKIDSYLAPKKTKNF